MMVSDRQQRCSGPRQLWKGGAAECAWDEMGFNFSRKQMMNDFEKMDIKELSLAELIETLDSLKIAKYRAGQLLRWVYQRQADHFDEMSDLKKDFRHSLSERFTIERLAKMGESVSADGSVKYLFKLKDGEAIETVLIPERDYFTLCVSSQVGCAQGCRFCATAAGGWVRNLTRGEILAQIRDVRHLLPDPTRLTNIVFMGMGEPLANYHHVAGALSTLTDIDHGFGFSTRRVTVSTAGLVPRMADLGRDSDVCLAVSLNATDNATRDSLMPINRTFPLEILISACKKYPLRNRRRITFEYILIRGINDSIQDAKKLVKLLHGVKCKVNLIPYNPHPGSDFARPEEAAISAFQKVLQDRHYTAIVRHSKGQDIAAACGQLRATFSARN
jgi:23S rRNA (adenine2503-C2)-methyltransferase